MTNFIKFSEIKKKRNELEQMANEKMSEVKGGLVVCTNNYFTCPNARKCPYNYPCRHISLYAVPMYGVPADIY